VTRGARMSAVQVGARTEVERDDVPGHDAVLGHRAPVERQGIRLHLLRRPLGLGPCLLVRGLGARGGQERGEDDEKAEGGSNQESHLATVRVTDDQWPCRGDKGSGPRGTAWIVPDVGTRNLDTGASATPLYRAGMLLLRPQQYQVTSRLASAPSIEPLKIAPFKLNKYRKRRAGLSNLDFGGLPRPRGFARGMPGNQLPISARTPAANSGNRISWCPVRAKPRAPSARVGLSTRFTRGR